jgi:hypothetical protein
MASYTSPKSENRLTVGIPHEKGNIRLEFKQCKIDEAFTIADGTCRKGGESVSGAVQKLAKFSLVRAAQFEFGSVM